MTENIYDIQVTNKDGSHYYLNKYKGKVMIIVNTATKCGLSDQFEELEALYQKYKDQGLVILGFPCNQFAKQEPGTDEQIAEVCKVNFGVTFPIHAKVDVNGKNESPLFTLLKNQAPHIYGRKIKWNFTKFIIDKEGHVVKRLAPKDSPKKAESLIQNLL